MDSSAEFAQLPLRLGDQTQWRYEVIRPLVLFADRTAAQRAHETATHPETVRTLHRRFREQGMLGLLPGDVEVVRRSRAGTVPDEVREEIARLKGLYDGFGYRELARIIHCQCHERLDDKTINWLRVLDTTESSQVDQRVGHQLHAIMPLLDTFETE